MSPVVSVVLVSYNTRALTLKALAALQSTAVPIELVVVDNASSDHSADAIGHAFGDVTVVRAGANLGFARAANLGAERATGRWLLLLNPDSEPVGDVVAALVEHAERHPEHRLYGGRTLRPDHSDDARSARALPTLWGHACFATGLAGRLPASHRFNPEGLPGFDRSLGGEVPALSSSPLLVDLALWRELGGFSPDFFVYGEDLDLSARARALGARPVLVPGARVLDVGTDGDPALELGGRTTYARLHWSPARQLVARAVLTAGVLLRAAGDPRWRAAWRQRSAWLPGSARSSSGMESAPTVRSA